MDYLQQLAHPKWQKKRLEILQRDNFTCTLCGDTETTLHIHHKQYGKMAWEVENEFLYTRCAHCHLVEEYYKKIHPTATDTILKVSKRESFGSYLVLYVYRMNGIGNKLLDIFSIDRNKKDDLSFDTVFCEKDLNSFIDFIHSLKNTNG